MKFLIDAHLPRSLCTFLAAHGHEAIHTLELPAQNATPDRIINDISVNDQRVVITKDSDFFYSHILNGRPWKLLLVKTGNISTHDLKTLLERNLESIERALANHTLVELDRTQVRALF